jgi:hypothetical protein
MNKYLKFEVDTFKTKEVIVKNNILQVKKSKFMGR